MKYPFWIGEKSHCSLLRPGGTKLWAGAGGLQVSPGAVPAVWEPGTEVALGQAVTRMYYFAIN